jgi:Tfp pilus assembly protein PilO
MASGRTMRRRLAVDRHQLLVLLAAAVMAASFFVLVLWPKQKDLSALGQAVERERATIRDKMRTSRESLSVGVRIAALRKAGGELARHLPTEPQLAAFLEQVAEQVAREPLVRHEIQRSEAVDASGAAPAVPVHLRLAGPMEGVYRCLAAVEGLERWTGVQRLRVARAGEDGEVTAEVDLLVYHLPVPEGAVPAGHKRGETVEG